MHARSTHAAVGRTPYGGGGGGGGAPQLSSRLIGIDWASGGRAIAMDEDAAAEAQARKWAMMESEEADLRQQLESSVSKVSASERAAMQSRLVFLSEQRERRNTEYFYDEKAQHLGNLLKDLGLIQYLYLVCGAYGTMHELTEDVHRRGVDAVAKTLIALPMAEEHAWRLLVSGLGFKGGPGATSQYATGKASSGNEAGTHGSSLSRGSSGAAGGGNGLGHGEMAGDFGDAYSEADSDRDALPRGDGQAGVGHGEFEQVGGSAGSEDDTRRRGWLSHAERVRRLLAMHAELMEFERLRASQRQQQRKKRRKERVQRVEPVFEIGSDEDHPLSGLLTATHKLWTARLDGVGVSVRGRTRCSRSVSLPMNKTLTCKDWQVVTMEFLQSRSEMWRSQHDTGSNRGGEPDDHLGQCGDGSPAEEFLRAVEEAMQAIPFAGGRTVPSDPSHRCAHAHKQQKIEEEHENHLETLRRTTRSGFRLPPIR